MRRSRKPVRAFRSCEGSNPSLSVSRQIRTFLPHGLPEDRPPAMGVSRSHFPATSPRPHHCPSRVGHGLAAITAPVSRPAHRVIIRSRQRRDTRSLLEVSTCGRSPARRGEGVVGASLPHSCPSSSPCVTYWLATQRTSPQYRRTARHARVARRSLPRGIPAPGRTSWRAAQRTGSYRARDPSGRSPHPALVADANVILSSLPGGRARLVIASVPGAARNTRIPASHERQCAREARSSDCPCRVGLRQAALLGRMGGARRRAC